MTAFMPAGYLSGQEKMKFPNELCKFYKRFTIIKLLIRPFPEKMDTKSPFSVLVLVINNVCMQKKL